MPTDRFWRRLIISTSCLLLGGIVVPRTAFFQTITPQGVAASAAGAQCSLASLQGAYMGAGTGVQIMGSNRVTFAYAGYGRYDGHGHVHGAVSQSVNGKVARLVRYTGTYTVNPDCTATETDTDATGSVSHYDEFTTPDGRLYTFVETDAGVESAGVTWRGTNKLVAG